LALDAQVRGFVAAVSFTEREIMLFIGNPKGRSKMISNE